jgi:DNA-binding FrmR family transcriptional regulator
MPRSNFNINLHIWVIKLLMEAFSPTDVPKQLQCSKNELKIQGNCTSLVKAIATKQTCETVLFQSSRIAQKAVADRAAFLLCEWHARRRRTNYAREHTGAHFSTRRTCRGLTHKIEHVSSGQKYRFRARLH